MSKPKRRLRGTGSYYFRTYKDRHGTIKKARFATLQYSVNGKTVKEKTKATTDREAERLLSKRVLAMDAGEHVGPSRVTVNELLDLVEDDYRANNRKADVLPRRFRPLKDAMGEVPAELVDEARISRYVHERRRTRSNATINRELAALQRGFRLAARFRLVSRTPHIAKLKEDNARTGFMERPAFLRIVKHLHEDYRALAWAGHITGWRTKSELTTRQRGKHLDLKARWLRLEPGETKNKRGRQFPLIDELHAVLSEQERRTKASEKELGRPIPWVFHRNGERIQMGSFYKAWKDAVKAAGLDGRIPHDFRRTAVRNLERAGVPRSSGKAMVGHLTDSIYSRYAIVDETMLKEAGKLLGLSLGLNARQTPSKSGRLPRVRRGKHVKTPRSGTAR